MIGGWIAGNYALRAQKQAAEHQRLRDLETERRAVSSVLQAIGTELTVLTRDFLERLQQADDARELGFQISGPLSRNYFAVFESNAAMLGRIEDRDLRERIISTYGSAKSLFDHLNYYSRQSDAGNVKLDELEQKIRAHIAVIQTMVSDVQKTILEYPVSEDCI
jgi:hypothetical protein